MSTCPICLDGPRDPVKAAPCGHVFCRTCIKTWMRQSFECPCCRQKMRRPPAERRFRPVPVIMLLLFVYLLIYSPLAPFLKTLAVTVGVAFKDLMLLVLNRTTLPFHLLFNMVGHLFSSSWIRIVHSVYEIITEVVALIQNSIILVFCPICIVIYSITTTLLSAVIT